jgi:hypothetical protein
MRKRRFKLLNNKYIIACYIKINKGTKVFYVPPEMSSRTPGGYMYPWLNTTALKLLMLLPQADRPKINRAISYVLFNVRKTLIKIIQSCSFQVFS